jgi:hypothetical protein
VDFKEEAETWELFSECGENFLNNIEGSFMFLMSIYPGKQVLFF